MRSLGGLVARLRQLFRRRREDAETEMELRFHLEMEAEKNRRAGLLPREADRQARVRLGGIEAIREAVRDARGTRPLEDLARDLGYALRAARRSPVFVFYPLAAWGVRLFRIYRDQQSDERALGSCPGPRSTSFTLDSIMRLRSVFSRLARVGSVPSTGSFRSGSRFLPAVDLWSPKS